MKVKFSIRGSRFAALALPILLWLTGALPAGAAVCQINWRFFTPVDGLAEAWSSYITLGPGGKVWVSHGGIKYHSWLDGWPGESGRLGNTIISPGIDMKIYESESGQLWSQHSSGIQLFQHGRWVKFFLDDIKNPYLPDDIVRKLTPFVPGGKNEAYYLLPDRLVRFEATREFRETVIDSLNGGIGGFIDMIPSRDGGIWITGSKGVARYYGKDQSAELHWQSFDLGRLGLTDFSRPIEGAGGELLVLGLIGGGDSGRQAVRYRNGRWSIVPQCSGELRAAWAGLDKSYWVWKENNQLVRVKDGRESRPDKRGMLAAEIRDVAVDDDGVFWLSTSHGLARYTPSLWKPFEHDGHKLWVHSILEDSSGVVWFACKDRIGRFSGGVWKEYPMPDGLSCQPFATQSLCALPDGRLAIGIMPYQNYLLTFDPATERFIRQDYRHPQQPSLEGHTNIGTIAPYGDGRILLETRLDQEPSGFKIELFDGENFEVLLDQSQNLTFGNPRYLLKTSDGELWIAGQFDNGARLSEQGEFRLLDVDSRFRGNGFFAICEVEPGKIWIGGREQIMQYHEGQWSSIRTGMASVRSIYKAADGSVWVASGTGVHRYRDGMWVTNTRQDGLSNEGVFSIFQDSRGTVWAGTIDGISIYSPSADIDPPQTLIFESRNLRETPPGGEVRLVYSGLDKWNRTTAGHLLFSSRLDGGGWSVFKPGNMAVFSNLPYGEHSFEVRAMDVNFNIDPNPARFGFTVLLPWYREAGFQWVMGVGTTIILFLIGLALYRHILLEKLVVARTNDLQTANVRLQTNLQELIVTQESLEDQQRKLETALVHESLLARIASMLNSTVNLPRALQEVTDTIADRLNLTKVCLTNLEETPFRFFDSIESQKGKNSGIDRGICTICRPGHDEIRRRLESDGLYRVAEMATAGPEIIESLRGKAVEAFSVLPVSGPAGIRGIACFCRREKYEWPPAELALLGTAVNMIASAWELHGEFQARLQAEKKQYEALQIADKASRMASIGVIAAGITHEINQPLNDIKVTADSVMMWDRNNKGILPGEFSSWLKSISGSVNRITGIIKHMRTYWVTPGRSGAERVEVADSVRKAISLVGNQLDAHGVKLTVKQSADKLSVVGSRINLEQIVLNLVVNAMHALDVKGGSGKKITVSVGRQDGQAFIRVVDNGPGLGGEEMDKLFDPFYTTKKTLDGMGLGLAIVKRFAEGFGGRVRVENNPGGGACFIVNLPLGDKSG